MDLIMLVIVYVNILSLFKFKELVFFSSRYKIYHLELTIILKSNLFSPSINWGD